MRRLSIAVIVVSLPLLVSAQTAVSVYGGASPQDVVAGIQKATKANDFAGAMAFVSADGRKELINSMLPPVLLAVRASNPDTPPPGAPAPSAAELARKRQAYLGATTLFADALRPHGLHTVVGQPPMAPATQKTIEAALAKTDTVALVRAIVASIPKIARLLGLPADEMPALPEMGPVTNYRIAGDKATAREGTNTLDFVRVGGRWYFTPPSGR